MYAIALIYRLEDAGIKQAWYATAGGSLQDLREWWDRNWAQTTDTVTLCALSYHVTSGSGDQTHGLSYDWCSTKRFYIVYLSTSSLY